MSESARLLTSPASARTAPFALLGAMATLLTTASLAQQQSPDWSARPASPLLYAPLGGIRRTGGYQEGFNPMRRCLRH